MTYYTHPQETWDEKKCRAMSRAGGRDYFGTKLRPGQIASDASTCAHYGQTVRYNGGCIRNGNWFDGECRPLPRIPAGWAFKHIVSWGTYIVKTQ